MKRFYLVFILLWMSPLMNPSIGEERFVEVRIGQHTHTLTTYKERLYRGLRFEGYPWSERGEHVIGDNRIQEIGSTFTNSLETKVDFGYRNHNKAYILGIGRFGEVKTSWKWANGDEGYASFDTYFADFTMRHYLGKSMKSHPKGLKVYGEGGMGLYLSRWRFNDDNIAWIGEWRKVTVEGWKWNPQENKWEWKTWEAMRPVYFINPKLENSDLGWHAGCGFEYHFSKDFSINLGSLYRWIYIENGWRFPEDHDIYLDPRDVVQDDIVSKEDHSGMNRYVYFFDVSRRYDTGLELDLSGLSLTLGFNLRF